MTSPAVSIVMPTYNRAAYLAGAIATVQAQTFADWELLVVDDGSTDASIDLVTSLARHDRRLHVLRNAGRQGPAGARNAGIAAARAGLVAFLDSDDRWEASKLAAFVDAARADPTAVLVGSDYRMAGSSDRDLTMKSFVTETMLPWWKKYAPARAVLPVDDIERDFGVFTQSSLALSATIAGFIWIHTSSAMVRRDALLQGGMFDDALRQTEDLDLWLKLARLGSFAYIDTVLATYDISGRDDFSGRRYQDIERSRSFTAYAGMVAHLNLLNRIERRYDLADLQLNLLRHRRAAHHRMCLDLAVRARSLDALRHLPSVMLASDERRWLVRTVLGRRPTRPKPPVQP